MQLSFSTSAQLAAFAFKTRHIGADVFDKQADLAYVVTSARHVRVFDGATTIDGVINGGLIA